jgi:RNA polymerase sigma-70 factor (ECF subfamily)
MREALERALVEEGDRLYALALRVTRDRDLAADAVHEAFVTALDRVSEFRGEARLSTWLHRIVYSKAIDLLRQRGRQVPLPDDPEDLGAADVQLAHSPSWSRPPDELLFGAETREALERALVELTPIQRAVFELAEVEGLRSDEVGERLGIPPGTARVHRHRARLKLRALLGPHFLGARA